MRFALRRLRRSPGFTLVAVTCMTLGVGVTTAIFSAVNGILLRPLPYPADQLLIAVHSQNTARDIHGSRVSMADVTSWRDGNQTLSALGVWTTGFLQLTGPEGDVERVDAAPMSASLFPTLGLNPIVGRNFTAAEERQGQDRVVLLSDGLWKRRFGGDRAILNHTIQISNQPYLVVGIMAPGVGFPEGAQIWTPIATGPGQSRHNARQLAGAV